MRTQFIISLAVLLITCNGTATSVCGHSGPSRRARTEVPLSNEALIKAVLDDDLDAVEELLNAGANPNLKFYDKDSERDATILMKAASNWHSEIVKALIKAGADVNERDEGGGTALWSAATRGSLDSVEALLKAGADVNAAIYSTRYTPLLSAAEGGHRDVVKALLAAGAFADARVTIRADIIGDRDDDGFTPLLWAADRNQTEIASMLIGAGADLHAKDMKGKTALMKATERDYSTMIELLRAAGASR